MKGIVTNKVEVKCEKPITLASDATIGDVKHPSTVKAMPSETDELTQFTNLTKFLAFGNYARPSLHIYPSLLIIIFLTDEKLFVPSESTKSETTVEYLQDQVNTWIAARKSLKRQLIESEASIDRSLIEWKNVSIASNPILKVALMKLLTQSSKMIRAINSCLSTADGLANVAKINWSKHKAMTVAQLLGVSMVQSDDDDTDTDTDTAPDTAPDTKTDIKIDGKVDGKAVRKAARPILATSDKCSTCNSTSSIVDQPRKKKRRIDNCTVGIGPSTNDGPFATQLIIRFMIAHGKHIQIFIDYPPGAGSVRQHQLERILRHDAYVCLWIISLR